MPFTLSEIVVLFFTYSVIGWIWETIYCSIKDHHYDYRGFLFGPYCPVYGFAVTTILICTYRVQDNLFLLYVVGVIVATIFEYCASVFLQYVFHMKLWDYSHLWGNIQGRVAPIISLFWGLGVVFLVKIVQPFIQKIINWEEARTHGYLALMILLVMGTDFILTIISVEKLHLSTKHWDERLNAQLKVDENKLNDRFDKLLESFSWNQKRVLTSFPHLKFTDVRYFNEVKHRLISRRENRS